MEQARSPDPGLRSQRHPMSIITVPLLQRICGDDRAAVPTTRSEYWHQAHRPVQVPVRVLGNKDASPSLGSALGLRPARHRSGWIGRYYQPRAPNRRRGSFTDAPEQHEQLWRASVASVGSFSGAWASSEQGDSWCSTHRVRFARDYFPGTREKKSLALPSRSLRPLVLACAVRERRAQGFWATARHDCHLWVLWDTGIPSLNSVTASHAVGEPERLARLHTFRGKEPS